LFDVELLIDDPGDFVSKSGLGSVNSNIEIGDVESVSDCWVVGAITPTDDVCGDPAVNPAGWTNTPTPTLIGGGVDCAARLLV